MAINSGFPPVIIDPMYAYFALERERYLQAILRSRRLPMAMDKPGEVAATINRITRKKTS